MISYDGPPKEIELWYGNWKRLKMTNSSLPISQSNQNNIKMHKIHQQQDIKFFTLFEEQISPFWRTDITPFEEQISHSGLIADAASSRFSSYAMPSLKERAFCMWILKMPRLQTTTANLSFMHFPSQISPSFSFLRNTLLKMMKTHQQKSNLSCKALIFFFFFFFNGFEQ